jgi:LysM repeat protein
VAGRLFPASVVLPPSGIRGKSPFTCLRAGLDSQEAKIARLIRMGLPPGPHLQPPQVRISGGTPGDAIKWVIEDIEWGDNVIYRSFGGNPPVRYRQDAVVHLLQFIEPAGPFAGSAPPRVRYYIVKKGDTLPKIAVKMYGDRGKWKVIAKANNLRDSKNLKVGRRLIIP